MFTAWSLGGYENWALHLLFLGGLGTFLASVLPMPKSWNGHDQQHGNLKNCKRLFAQPFFWVSILGMFPATLVYVNAGNELSKINSFSDILSFQVLISF